MTPGNEIDDPRFSLSLLAGVEDVLRAHRYGPFAPADHARLSSALFRFLYPAHALPRAETHPDEHDERHEAVVRSLVPWGEVGP